MIREIWLRLRHGSRRIWQHPEWTHFAGAGWADRIMDVPVTDRLHAKQGRSIGRWTLAAGHHRLTVYLKRHYGLPRWLGLFAALCPWRVWAPGGREWRNLEWASAHGLPAPRALAAGEIVGPKGKLKSFLVVEELANMLPLHEAVPLAAKRLAPLAFAAWKRGLIAEMARMVRMLHERQRFHQDLYLCHFYVAVADIDRPPDNWKRKVYLIDFHRLCRRRLTAFFGRVKDLAQLLYSARIEGVTGPDRLRFWRAYRSDRAGRLLRWTILWKSRRYAKHNRKRRSAFSHVPWPRTAVERRTML